VDLACTALDEFTAEPRPKALYIVAASFDLALAHLVRGDLTPSASTSPPSCALPVLSTAACQGSAGPAP
jgi:hypothetical protein